MPDSDQVTEWSDAALLAQTAPGRVLATVERQRFYDVLQPGDVVLFGSLEDTGVLGESIERRPVYHSSMYIGKYPDSPADPRLRTERAVVLHNLSYLWWELNTGTTPHRNSAAPVEMARDLWLPASSSELYGGDDPQLQHEHRRMVIEDILSKRGGVGPTFIDAYLDVDVEERLWYHTISPKGDSKPYTQRVRKIRRAVALRHQQLIPPGGDPQIRNELKKAMIEIANDWNRQKSGGFPAAELAAMVPTLSQRPGFEHMVPGQIQPELGVAASHYEPKAGARAICAMYCQSVFDKAGLPLSLESVPRYNKRDATYHTPRDLWDCQDLIPIAMLVVPPDRGTAFMPAVDSKPRRLPSRFDKPPAEQDAEPVGDTPQDPGPDRLQADEVPAGQEGHPVAEVHAGKEGFVPEEGDPSIGDAELYLATLIEDLLNRGGDEDRGADPDLQTVGAVVARLRQLQGAGGDGLDGEDLPGRLDALVRFVSLVLEQLADDGEGDQPFGLA